MYCSKGWKFHGSIMKGMIPFHAHCTKNAQQKVKLPQNMAYNMFHTNVIMNNVNWIIKGLRIDFSGHDNPLD
jgi:hypoxanthine-guanine phosphoribosyltransferase